MELQLAVAYEIYVVSLSLRNMDVYIGVLVSTTLGGKKTKQNKKQDLNKV